jgi:hypothetical protein
MSTRRGFLALLGLAGPAAVLAPKAMLDSGKATDTLTVAAEMPMHPPVPAFIGNLVQGGEPMRYLGLAQLKNEGDWLRDPGWPMTERKWDDPWPKREDEA